MTALSALTPAAGLVRQDNKDAAYAGRRLFAVTADLSPCRRAWDHADRDTVLRLRPITEDHTLGNLTWSPGLLAPALKRHLTAGWMVQPI